MIIFSGIFKFIINYMAKFIINGKAELSGAIEVKGAKKFSN